MVLKNGILLIFSAPSQETIVKMLLKNSLHVHFEVAHLLDKLLKLDADTTKDIFVCDIE